MGRLDDQYRADLKIVVNHSVGGYYKICILYIVAPFLYPLYDGLVANWLAEGIRFIPTRTEFLIIEASVTFILALRFLRDYILRNKILPKRSNVSNLMFAIKKIELLMKKTTGKDDDYSRSLKSIMERNKRLLRDKER